MRTTFVCALMAVSCTVPKTTFAANLVVQRVSDMPGQELSFAQTADMEQEQDIADYYTQLDTTANMNDLSVFGTVGNRITDLIQGVDLQALLQQVLNAAQGQVEGAARDAALRLLNRVLTFVTGGLFRDVEVLRNLTAALQQIGTNAIDGSLEIADVEQLVRAIPGGESLASAINGGRRIADRVIEGNVQACYQEKVFATRWISIGETTPLLSGRAAPSYGTFESTPAPPARRGLSLFEALTARGGLSTNGPDCDDGYHPYGGFLCVRNCDNVIVRGQQYFNCGLFCATEAYCEVLSENNVLPDLLGLATGIDGVFGQTGLPHVDSILDQVQIALNAAEGYSYPSCASLV